MLELLLNALKQILQIFFPLFLLILFWTLGKMLYRRYKYGIGYYDILKKSRLNTRIDDDVMALTLKQLKGNFEIIETPKLNARFAILCGSGMILIEMCNIHEGKITGNQEEQQWVWNHDGKKQWIDNPFLKQKEDLLLLKEKFPSIPVKAFVVFGNDLLFDFVYHGESVCARNKSVIYKIQEFINLQEEKIKEEEWDSVRKYLK